MSWSVSVVGRAGKLALIIRERFKKTQGAFLGAETDVKDMCGEIAETLCRGMGDQNSVININASGSAWVDGGNYRSHNVKLEITSVYGFEE